MRKTAIAAVLGLALALAGCTTTEQKNADDIPTEAKDNFVDTCAESAQRTRPGNEREIRDGCRCVVDKLDERMPYAREGANNDFKDADTATREGRQLTGGLQDDFDGAAADCGQDR